MPPECESKSAWKTGVSLWFIAPFLRFRLDPRLWRPRGDFTNCAFCPRLVRFLSFVVRSSSAFSTRQWTLNFSMNFPVWIKKQIARQELLKRLIFIGIFLFKTQNFKETLSDHLMSYIFRGRMPYFFSLLVTISKWSTVESVLILVLLSATVFFLFLKQILISYWFVKNIGFLT